MGAVTLTQDIKNYLDSLNEVEHDRLLTTTLVPRIQQTIGADGKPAGCLVGVARGAAEQQEWLHDHPDFDLGAHGWLTNWRKGRVPEWMNNPLAKAPMYEQFNRLAEVDQEGTQQAIRDYIVELRLRDGGTVAEPDMTVPVAAKGV